MVVLKPFWDLRKGKKYDLVEVKKYKNSLD